MRDEYDFTQGERGKYAHFDLPPEVFPFTISVYDEATGELLKEYFVQGPGAMEVEGFAPRKVYVCIQYADGTYEETHA